MFARRSLIDQSKFLNLLVCKTSHTLETRTGQLLGIKLATLTCQGNLSTKLTASPVGLPPTYRASLLSFQREMSSLGLVVARETSFSGPEQRYLLVLVVVGGQHRVLLLRTTRNHQQDPDVRRVSANKLFYSVVLV